MTAYQDAKRQTLTEAAPTCEVCGGGEDAAVRNGVLSCTDDMACYLRYLTLSKDEHKRLRKEARMRRAVDHP